MLDTSSELNELKSLLFDEEIDAFESFEKRLAQLNFDLNDTQQVITRVSPLVDEMLLEKLQGKDDAYMEKYADLMATIINKSANKDFPKLRQSLQTIISPAISKEIDENKDKMVDALYPIMGSMISKYVSQAIKEMMESINDKIEDGLSFDKYKRKAKAKFTGVSEAELLLEEGSDATISSLFVIQKETGLLIAEGKLKHNEINDPHMVASMASAIKDFINDWVQNDENKSEVQILSYGNATLYIESAGSVYVIAFLDAEPDQEQRREINTFFASLVKEYSGFFQTFDGDDSSPEVKALSHKLSMYLSDKQSIPNINSKRSNPVKILLWFLGLSVIMYGLYTFYIWYDTYSLEHKIFQQTNQVVEISKKDDTLILSGEVNAAEDIYKIEKIVKRNSKNLKIQDNLMLPMKYIDKRFIQQKTTVQTSQKSLVNELAILQSKFEKKLNTLNNKIDILVHNNETQRNKIKYILEIKSKINNRLDSNLENSPFYDKNHHAMNFSKLNLFPKATQEIDKDALKILLKHTKRYIDTLIAYKKYFTFILIGAHSDSSGRESKNIQLSQQRAKIISDAIKNIYIKDKKANGLFLKPIGYGSNYPIIKNGIEDKIASRRIEIKFNLEEKVLMQKMRELLND